MTCTAEWVTLHNIKACPIFREVWFIDRVYQFLLRSEQPVYFVLTVAKCHSLCAHKYGIELMQYT